MGGYSIDVRNIGAHEDRKYLRLYKSDQIPETKYYNTCACNEYAAFVGRHIIGPLEQTDPVFIEREFNKVISELDIKETMDKLTVDATLECTRKNRLQRYVGVVRDNRAKRIITKEITPRVSAFVKFEKTPADKIEEGKAPRMVQARSYPYCFEVKRYLTKFSKFARNTEDEFRGQKLSHIFMKYQTNPEKARLLRESWDMYEDPVALCLDQKAFDAHVNEYLLRGEQAFWKFCFKNKELGDLLLGQINNYGYTKHGIAYKVNGTRMSGDYNTSDGNSFINLVMLASFTQGLKVRIHLDGDDSVLILERKDLEKLPNLKPFFLKFGMECKVDLQTSVFEEITFCQASPVFVNGRWMMVKEWKRDVSRSSVCPAQYAKAADRYLAGTALCALAVNTGVPILQTWALRRLIDSKLTRPLGSVDKFPALDADNAEVKIDNITDETRISFARAYNISPQDQIFVEEALLAGNHIDDNIYKYIQKYSKFHLN